MINYGMDLFHFYAGEDNVSIVLEETNEQSEKNDKDSSDTEDTKEKDKISQYADNKRTGISYYSIKYYPDLIYENLSVYLEYTTPPPEVG